MQVQWLVLQSTDPGAIEHLPQMCQVPEGCTVLQALDVMVPGQAEELLAAKRVAVFGLLALPGTVLHPGDRIEVLDDLRFNPMDSRRRRAAHKQAQEALQGRKIGRRSRRQGPNNGQSNPV